MAETKKDRRKHKNNPKRSNNKKLLSSRFLAQLMAQVADSKKADDIEILDVRKTSSISNYIVVCTAGARPQIKAIADAIDELMSKNGISIPRWQGNADSNWMVLDMINVVVHIFGKDERKAYNIEGLWSQGGVVYHI